MADNSRAINRVFTRKVICDLIENGRNDVFDYVVKRYIDDPSNKNHGQLISEIYAHLDKQQRNEYLEYLPTQFITEFIKSRGYAGVSYTSTMGTGGTNIAVFDETLFECESVHVVEINSIEYSYSNVN